jgi:hypothetical protein
VKKNRAFRLHIAARVVELFDPTASPGNTGFSERETRAMKRLMILTTLALVTASTAGCWHWFNRGTQCDPCAPVAGAYADPCMGAPSVSGPNMLPSPVVQTVPMQ